MSNAMKQALISAFILSILSADSSLNTRQISVPLEQKISTSFFDMPFKKSKDIPYGWPTLGWISSGFGYRLLKDNCDFHGAIDIGTDTGSDVYATGKGTVTYVDYADHLGLFVIVSHANGFESLYGHLLSATVKEGDSVERKQLIALSGSSGGVKPHLHYAVRLNGEEIDPHRLGLNGKMHTK